MSQYTVEAALRVVADATPEELQTYYVNLNARYEMDEVVAREEGYRKVLTAIEDRIKSIESERAFIDFTPLSQ